jgi:hypothetical protein
MSKGMNGKLLTGLKAGLNLVPGVGGAVTPLL